MKSSMLPLTREDIIQSSELFTAIDKLLARFYYEGKIPVAIALNVNYALDDVLSQREQPLERNP